LRRVLNEIDPSADFVEYYGQVPHDQLRDHYRRADVFAFASSCENMPNILLEAMASGLPIACSDRGPMPEILRDGGVYFDPESSGSIARALALLIHSPELRRSKALAAYEYSMNHSWKSCSDRTFQLLASIALGDLPAADLACCKINPHLDRQAAVGAGK
jgi:glycosyltransferase involved in cell wall biosynthesis